jgi:integrase
VPRDPRTHTGAPRRAVRRTRDNYAATLRRDILPAFGRLKVAQLRRSRIKLFLAEKLTALSPNSVRLIYAVMRLLLASAVGDGVLPANPGEGLGRKLRLHRPAAEREATIKAMTRGQLSLFLATAKRVAPGYWTPFLVFARTGMRLGEVLGLQWVDLDSAGRTIRVARAFSNDRLETTPKGNRARTIDMSRQLAHALRRLELERKAETLRRGWPNVPAWVFCDETGQPVKGQRVERWFKRVLEVAGLPRHFSPHSLRHTYASILLADGVSPVYVQRQLGHATFRLTVDLYGRWLPMENKAAVDRLDDRDEAVSEARGSRMVAAAVADSRKLLISKAGSIASGPTGPRWAPLSRTRAR